jgi:hypothetical protein
LVFRKIVLLLISAFGLLLHPPFVFGGTEVRFSIVYTNDVMGEVEPCG